MPSRPANGSDNPHHPAQRQRKTGGPREEHQAAVEADAEAVPLALGARPLTLDDVAAVAQHGAPVTLSEGAIARIRTARALVDRLVTEDRTVYGVTTGFGHLSRVKIPITQIAELQRNLVRSHASGVGEPFDVPTARAVMLLLASSLTRGHSGVRLDVPRLLVGMLNAGVTPIIPTRGSVGASGDLAPLAHLSLVLIGEGEAWHAGERLPGAVALERARLSPIQLQAKEGLALINGTHIMEACGALAIRDAWRLLRAAEVSMAATLEGLLGSYVPLDPRIHALRPQRGQTRSAARLRALLHDSQINPSHANDGRVQDPYSLRCAPQVFGAVRNALTYCEDVFTAELGAVTDNPLLFPAEGDVLTGGNFHGQPLALALDFLALALAQLASFSERRTYLLMGPRDWDTGPHAAPIFLTPNPGLRSGYMIAQYAAAALVNEIKVLAHPASIDSIPTSAGQEDFVSMGATSALKLRQSLDLAHSVIAIELLCACQALDFRRPLLPGRGVLTAYEAVRALVPHVEEDRPPAPDIERIAAALRDGLLDDLAPEAAFDDMPPSHNGRAR